MLAELHLADTRGGGGPVMPSRALQSEERKKPSNVYVYTHIYIYIYIYIYTTTSGVDGACRLQNSDSRGLNPEGERQNELHRHR